MPDIILCRVEVLDESVLTIDLNKKAFGHHLLEQVFKHVSVRERDYFGLQFENEKGLKEWVDALKPLKKQLRDAPAAFRFLVKFYAAKPDHLQDEATRYLYCLQLRKDLLNALLPCSVDTAALLASLAVQSEYGEYDPSEHDEEYLHSFSMLHNEPPEFVDKVAKLHASHGKTLPTEADFLFILECSKLPFFGVHLYDATLERKDQRIKVGVSFDGVAVYEGDLPHMQLKTLHHWYRVTEVYFNRKKLGVSVAPEELGTSTSSASSGSSSTKSNETAVFRFERESLCKIVWKTIVEHHTFFRRHTPDDLPKDSLFNRSMSHRFSGRTQKQVIQDTYNPDGTRKPEKEFVRTSSLTRQHFRVVGPNFSSPSSSSLHSRSKLARQDSRSSRNMASTVSSSSLPGSSSSLPGARGASSMSNGSGTSSPAYPTSPSPASDVEGHATLNASNLL